MTTPPARKPFKDELACLCAGAMVSDTTALITRTVMMRLLSCKRKLDARGNAA
jgi:hypothetical protein